MLIDVLAEILFGEWLKSGATGDKRCGIADESVIPNFCTGLHVDTPKNILNCSSVDISKKTMPSTCVNAEAHSA